MVTVDIKMQLRLKLDHIGNLAYYKQTATKNYHCTQDGATNCVTFSKFMEKPKKYY